MTVELNCAGCLSGYHPGSAKRIAWSPPAPMLLAEPMNFLHDDLVIRTYFVVYKSSRTKLVVYEACVISCDYVATGGGSLFQRCELLNQVEAKGIRLTAQRRVLIEAIQEAATHLDAADLLKQARQRDPNIDRATVYRTIELLKKLGMIDELDLMHLNGEKHYYEVKTQQDHLHLACFECGAILEYTSLAFERLKQEIAAANQFEIQVVRLEVGGLCGACAAKKEERLQ
jgi:Fur family transcriptional regulator, ferric uptake regulator